MHNVIPRFPASYGSPASVSPNFPDTGSLFVSGLSPQIALLAAPAILFIVSIVANDSSFCMTGYQTEMPNTLLIGRSDLIVLCAIIDFARLD